MYTMMRNRMSRVFPTLVPRCLFLPRAAAADTDFRMWGDIDVSLSRLENADFTNDKGDGAVEVNFNHQLKVYENLIIAADLGYINMDRCEEWGSRQDVSDARQAAVNFRIKF